MGQNIHLGTGPGHLVSCVTPVRAQAAGLLAMASDEPLELDVPRLDINNAGMVADFIEEKFLK